MDDSILLELKALGYGYKRIAGEYTRLTSQFVSHMTIRDRLIRRATAEEWSSPVTTAPSTRSRGHAGGRQE